MRPSIDDKSQASAALHSAFFAMGTVSAPHSSVDSDSISTLSAIHAEASMAASSRISQFNRTAAINDARTLENSATQSELFANPLWLAGVPEEIDAAIDTLRAFWAAAPAVWDFWRRWYDGMLAGEPLDWELQRRVALVPDEVWKAGPEAVADAIAEIERELGREQLDQDALRSHAERLVASPGLHADAAEATARLIEDAVQRFKVEAPANALPEGFEPFERLGPRFRQISVVLVSERATDAKISALQSEINALHATVQQLRRALREANDKLRDARLDRIEAAQMRTFGEKLTTTLTNLTLIGALGMSTLTFFGVRADEIDYQGLKSRLIHLAEAMRNAEPRDAPTPLPTIHDI